MPSLATTGYYNMAQSLFNQPSQAQAQAQQQGMLSQVGDFIKRLMPGGGQQQPPQAPPATFNERFGTPQSVPNMPSLSPFGSPGPMPAAAQPWSTPKTETAQPQQHDLIPAQTPQGDLIYAPKESKEISPADAAHQEAITQTLNTVGLTSPSQARQAKSRLGQLVDTLQSGNILNPATVRESLQTPFTPFQPGMAAPTPPVQRGFDLATPLSPTPTPPVARGPQLADAREAIPLPRPRPPEAPMRPPIPLPQPRPPQAPQAPQRGTPPVQAGLPAPTSSLLSQTIGDLGRQLPGYLTQMIPEQFKNMTLGDAIKRFPDWRSNPMVQTFLQAAKITPDQIDSALKANVPQQAAPQPQGQAPTTEAPPTSGSAISPSFMNAVKKIESGGNPNAATGRYKGLYQLSEEEFRRYGGQGSIFDPKENERVAALMLRDKAAELSSRLGRPATPAEIYLAHQQGVAGAYEHLTHPDQPAWRSMLSTGEGREKGEGWARQAIWGNVPSDMKARFGSVDNVSSRQFADMWSQKYARAAGEPSSPLAYATAAAPQRRQVVQAGMPGAGIASDRYRRIMGGLGMYVFGGGNPRDYMGFINDAMDLHTRIGTAANYAAAHDSSPAAIGGQLADFADEARGIIQRHAPETSGNGAAGGQGAAPASTVENAPSATVGPTEAQAPQIGGQRPSGSQVGAVSAHMAQEWDEVTRAAAQRNADLQMAYDTAMRDGTLHQAQWAENNLRAYRNERVATAQNLLSAQSTEQDIRNKGYQMAPNNMGLLDMTQTPPALIPWGQMYRRPGQVSAAPAAGAATPAAAQQGPQFIPNVPVGGGAPSAAPQQPPHPSGIEPPQNIPQGPQEEWTRGAAKNALPPSYNEMAQDPYRWLSKSAYEGPGYDIIRNEWSKTTEEQRLVLDKMLNARQVLGQMRRLGEEKTKTTGSTRQTWNNLVNTLMPGSTYARRLFLLNEGDVPNQEQISVLQDQLSKAISTGQATDASMFGPIAGAISYFASATPGSRTTQEGFNGVLDLLDSYVDRGADRASFLMDYADRSNYMGNREYATWLFETYNPMWRYEQQAEAKRQHRIETGQQPPPTKPEAEQVNPFAESLQGARRLLQYGRPSYWGTR